MRTSVRTKDEAVCVSLIYGEKAYINKRGRITAEVKRVFQTGQCHALALALNELAGLPLVGLYTQGPEYGTPDHTAVQLASGTVLDIEGPDAQERWSHADVVPVTREQVEEFENIDYVPPAIEAAKPFAKALLKKYNIHPFPFEATEEGLCKR